MIPNEKKIVEMNNCKELQLKEQIKVNQNYIACFSPAATNPAVHVMTALFV